MIAKFDNGTAQPNLSGADLATFDIPIPGSTTQQRIVAKIEELFSTLDKGVESLTAARERLTAYRQAVLKCAFEGKLTSDWRAANPAKTEPAEALLRRVRTEREAATDSAIAPPGYQREPAEDVPGWVWVSVRAICTESLIGLVRSGKLQNKEGCGASYIKMDRLDMQGRVSTEAEVFVEVSADEKAR